MACLIGICGSGRILIMALVAKIASRAVEEPILAAALGSRWPFCFWLPRLQDRFGPGLPRTGSGHDLAVSDVRCFGTTCYLQDYTRSFRNQPERSAMGPDINNPLTIGLVAFAVIVAGAFAGWKGRDHLPDHHRTEETKSVVSVSMTVVATISALVLGLLISNANTSFSRLGGEVTTLSAQILRLDQVLRRYGSDTDRARNLLRQYAEQKAADLFPENANVQLRNPWTYE